MVGLFAWMKQERVDGPGAALDQAHVEEDSADHVEEVGVATPEVRA